MSELAVQFVVEARDLLQTAGAALLALERRPGDPGLVNDVFRTVHTLKGASGLFDVAPMTGVLHAAEDCLSAIREGDRALSPDLADLLLAALDQVTAWLDRIETDETLPDDSAAAARQLTAPLRVWLGAAEPASADAAPPSESVSLRRFPAEAIASAARAGWDASLPVCAVAYRPDPGSFFRGDDPLLLATRLPGLHAIEVAPAAPPAAPEALDPFSCWLEFDGLCVAPRGAVAGALRYVEDESTLAEMDPADLLTGAVEGPASLPAGLAAELRSIFLAGDATGFTIRAAASPPEAARALALLGGICGAPAASAALFDALVAPGHATETSLPPALRHLLDAQLTLLDFADEGSADTAGHRASAARTATAALRAAGFDDLAARAASTDPAGLRAILANLLAPAAPDPAAPGPASSDPAHAGTRPGRVLRVDQAKVDLLMNLVSELIVAKNGLPFLARRAELKFGARELGREIKDHFAVIDRIVQEVQGAVMSVQMLPLGQAFQRFPRLVRDIARKLGKQVELVTEGEDTEADRNLIETLHDPLLHMVRNSLDHGIEPPVEREAAGKPPVASLRLRALREGDRVIIEVADDGRGIDPEAIRRKAFEKGLIDAATRDRLDRAGALRLVFLPGFSTAEAVSDLSGRGVGMDAVRAAIERLGGTIGIDSAAGRGTTVRLDLPLTMAVSRVMTVEIGGQSYGIPIELIVETVRVPARRISRIRAGEVFVLRDRTIPLLRASRLLGLDEAARPDVAADVPVAVLRIAGRSFGLAVDAFGEGMDVVVKPLDGVLATIPGYSGSTVLGDGRVLLILDVREILP
jgi:two-component system chemotaxis sensor kinase CheA